jgi:hypothetical protein
VLPAEAAGIQGEWPTVRQICRVIRSRQVKKNGEWQKPQHEVVYLVSSLPAAASPQALLGVNRDHWRIEIMHRNKDVILGEDGYTNRCDNAPRTHRLRSQNPEIRRTLTDPRHRALSGRQKPRNPAVFRFLLNHPEFDGYRWTHRRNVCSGRKSITWANASLPVNMVRIRG